MSKQLYSLLLDNFIVEEIDRAAYQRQISRSGLINRILAEYTSLTTPEMRIGNIFAQMLGQIESVRALRANLQNSMLSVHSAIKFKYNPTVRYRVELFKEPDKNGVIGILCVFFRTQNDRLISYLENFCTIWNQCETEHIKKNCGTFSGGKYNKIIYAKDTSASAEKLAEDITNYILALDQAMKTYFASGGDGAITPQIKRIYDGLLTNGRMIE